ncbi:MAG: mannitol dehydrogenase family protein [Rhodobacteraceae bacterium]|nr:mannitol dehydrogenase family protein [Paracoccaceae bacterium]
MPQAARRLDEATLAEVPAAIRRPNYDRAGLGIACLHLGVGAFHRCHQAEYMEDLLASGLSRGGLFGVNLAPPALGPMLGRQDGLYSRTLHDGTASETRVIGAILKVADGAAAALALLADPAISTVTLTVTEKAYCHVPATGELDEARAEVAADLADLADPADPAGQGGPASLPGLLACGLARRARARAGPINLISCDNLPANGAILARVVRGFAGRALPGLAGWIEDNVAFPATMVDRIVPATTAAGLDSVAARLGLRDEAAVQGEPFRQWVIEDAFRAPRPRWEAAGVEIVADVGPHVLTKMRVLNAAQTMLALAGALAGHDFTHEAAADRALARWVGRTLAAETLPHLPPAPGMAPGPYLAASLARIANAGIAHRCHQIATDTSQKIRQRLLDPIRACRGAGAPHPGLTRGVGAWIAYLARSGPDFGARWTVSDPVMARAGPAILRHGRDIAGLTREILSQADIFGPDLSGDAAFAAEVTAAAQGLLDAPRGPPPAA